MPIVWGAGLTIVLQSLPSLVIPPVLISTLPTILARALPPSSSPDAVKAFLELPAPLRALISLVMYAAARKAVGEMRRRSDRKRLGPDVVEAPRMKCWLPGNVDFISEIIHSREVGEFYLQSRPCEVELIGGGRLLWRCLEFACRETWEYI